MDPFSITVGAVGLAEAGTSLAGFLTDKYRSYRDAPELILEVAHEVEFCAGMVDMFAGNVDRAAVGGKVPGRFVRDAKGLVERTQIIFRDIQELIPEERDLDATFSKARWRFALDRKKLKDHQQRLRQAQQMFLFMESMYRYQYPANTNGPAVSGSKDPNTSRGSGSQEQSLTGVLANQIPMQATGVGPDGQSFEVTLTLKPVLKPEPATTYGSMPVPESRSAIPIVAREKPALGRSMLEGLRRSPFFDATLLSKERPSNTASTGFANYEEAIFPSDSMKNSEESGRPFGRVLDATDRKKEEQVKLKVEAQQRMGADEGDEDEQRRLDAVDGITAKGDIDDLSRRWFGDSDEQSDDDTSLGTPSSPEVAELVPFPAGDQRSGGYDVAEYDGDPSPRPGSARYQSPSRLPQCLVYLPSHPTASDSVGRERPPPPPYADPSRLQYDNGQDYVNAVVCDGCDKKIRSGSPRQRCRNCDPSFDLCAHCFANPDMTLRHRHPKSYFLRSTVD